MADVAQYGLDALAHIRANRVADVDIVEGLLFGLDGDGEIVVADAATGVKAVGVVVNGSPDNWGAAKAFSKTSTLKAGLGADLNNYAIIDVDEATYTNAQIGTKVYLGASGAYTLTQNTTIGQLDQWVGKVWSTASILIDISNDPEGTTVAASNDDVVEITADGALAIKGIGLVTTGAVSPVALTLAAPVPQAIVRVKVVTDGGQDLVVTSASGVTLNGTNNTATFADALDELVLGYKSATEWVVIENVGSVAFSTV